MLIATLNSSVQAKTFRADYTVLISYLGFCSQGLSDAQSSHSLYGSYRHVFAYRERSLVPACNGIRSCRRINRLTLARTKLEKKLEIIHECILEAIEKKTVKSKKWLQNCEESMDIAVSKNEETSF